VTAAADAIDVRFNGPTPPVLPYSTPLMSGGNTVEYDYTNPHFLVARETGSGQTVFTIAINNSNSSSATYEFILYKPLDHVDYGPGILPSIDLPIAYRVIDSDGDYKDTTFTITVVDDFRCRRAC